MLSVPKQWLAMTLVACPGLFFVNPPFWTVLLMSDQAITPQVKELAKNMRIALESVAAAHPTDPCAGRRSCWGCLAANQNEHLVRPQMLGAEDETAMPIAA